MSHCKVIPHRSSRTTKMRLMMMCNGRTPSKTFTTSWVLTHVWAFACVFSEMDFEIVTPRKGFATVRFHADEPMRGLYALVMTVGGELGGTSSGVFVGWELWWWLMMMMSRRGRR